MKKQCPRCKEKKPASQFYHSSGRQSSWCKDCISKRAKSAYIDNMVVLNTIKTVSGCERCGFDEHYSALVFHHRDPSKKSFGLNNPGAKSLKTVLEEVLKCDVLCANCHHIVHWGEKDA